MAKWTLKALLVRLHFNPSLLTTFFLIEGLLESTLTVSHLRLVIGEWEQFRVVFPRI